MPFETNKTRTIMIKTLTSKSISISPFLPLFLISVSLALYANAFLRLDDIAHLGMSMLYFIAISKLLLSKHQEQGKKYQTSLASASCGVLILGLTGWLMLNYSSENFWRAMPLVSGFGLTFIVSKFQSLKYWRELLILFFLGLPKLLIAAFYDPSPLTAKISGLALYYTGLEARVVEQVYVMLPTGGVKVFEGCSGLESVCYTLGLSVVCLMIYPVSRRMFYWIVPVVAIAIGFFVNIIRVALLAILNAWQYKSAFIYWHEGDGSLIFGMIAVFVFAAFYYFLPPEPNLELGKKQCSEE